mgnify:CR=1 FL=1
MKQYKNLLDLVLHTGVDKNSDVRTKYLDGTVAGYRSIDTEVLRFDLREGFPLTTSSKKSFDIIAKELLWFISGKTNLKALTDQGVNIWTKDSWRQHCRMCEAAELQPQTYQEFCDSDQDHDLGPIYGKQWRNFGGVDQLQNLVNSMNEKPNDRRMIVSAWNPPEMPAMALPPCHLLFQVFSYPMELDCRTAWATRKLGLDLDNHDPQDDLAETLTSLGVPTRYFNMTMYQRSVDTFLGLPFNIASYALLMEIIGKLTNQEPTMLKMVLGDIHVYDRHEDQVREIIARDPLPLPQIHVLPLNSLDDLDLNSFHLEGYHPHPAIKGEMAF